MTLIPLLFENNPAVKNTAWQKPHKLQPVQNLYYNIVIIMMKISDHGHDDDESHDASDKPNDNDYNVDKGDSDDDDYDENRLNHAIFTPLWNYNTRYMKIPYQAQLQHLMLLLLRAWVGPSAQLVQRSRRTDH